MLRVEKTQIQATLSGVTNFDAADTYAKGIAIAGSRDESGNACSDYNPGEDDRKFTNQDTATFIVGFAAGCTYELVAIRFSTKEIVAQGPIVQMKRSPEGAQAQLVATPTTVGAGISSFFLPFSVVVANTQANANAFNDGAFVYFSGVQSRGLAAAITAGTAKDDDEDGIEDGVNVELVNLSASLKHTKPSGGDYQIEGAAELYLAPDSAVPTLPLFVTATVSTNVAGLFASGKTSIDLIANFPPVPVLVVDPEKTEVDERNPSDEPSTTDGFITLKLEHPTTEAPLAAGDYIRLAYSSEDGPATGKTGANTATAGSDYRAEEGTVFIPPGDTEVRVPVQVLADSTEEEEEFYRVHFWADGPVSKPRDKTAQASDPTATGLVGIQDDDCTSPIVSFGAQTYRFAERTGSGNAQTEGTVAVKIVLRDPDNANTPLPSCAPYPIVKWKIDNIFGGDAAGTNANADTGGTNAKFNRDYYLSEGTTSDGGTTYTAGTPYASGTASGSGMEFETTFAAGETEKVIFVKARRDDLADEKNEKFALTLTSIRGTGGVSSGRGVLSSTTTKLKTAITINDVDEAKPTATLHPTTTTGQVVSAIAISTPSATNVNHAQTMKEGDSPTDKFMVKLSRKPFGPLPVKVRWDPVGVAKASATPPYKATEAADFNLPNDAGRTLSFAPIAQGQAGEDQKVFTLTVAPDGDSEEGLEAANLTLTAIDDSYVTLGGSPLLVYVIDKALAKPGLRIIGVFGNNPLLYEIKPLGDLGTQGSYYLILRPTRYGSIAEALKARNSGDICTRARASVPGKTVVPSSGHNIVCHENISRFAVEGPYLPTVANTEYEIGITNSVGAPLGNHYKNNPLISARIACLCPPL